MKFTTIVTVTNTAFLKMAYSQVISVTFTSAFLTNYPEKEEEKIKNTEKKA